MSNVEDPGDVADYEHVESALLVTAERDGYFQRNVTITLRRDEQRWGLSQSRANRRPDVLLCCLHLAQPTGTQIMSFLR